MCFPRKFDSWSSRYSYIPIHFASVLNKNTFLQETSTFVFFSTDRTIQFDSTEEIHDQREMNCSLEYRTNLEFPSTSFHQSHFNFVEREKFRGKIFYSIIFPSASVRFFHSLSCLDLSLNRSRFSSLSCALSLSSWNFREDWQTDRRKRSRFFLPRDFLPDWIFSATAIVYLWKLWLWRGSRADVNFHSGYFIGCVSHPLQ